MAISSEPSRRAPIWPLLVAPLIVGAYYINIKSGFSQSIEYVLGKDSVSDVTVSEFVAPVWGPHWIYRIFAEFIALSIATLIASGIARGREFAGAIIASGVVAFVFLIRVSIIFFAWKYQDNTEEFLNEPWYQNVIDGLIVLAAIPIGIFVSHYAVQINNESKNGFGGINRAHYFWLWIPAFWYSIGLITPVVRMYIEGYQHSILRLFFAVLINGVPAAAIALPGYIGLSLLTGEKVGKTLNPIVRNILGVLVLVVGFGVGFIVESGWYWLASKVIEKIWG